MVTESTTAVQRQEVPMGHAHPLLAVLTWELRRIAADRIAWGLGGAASIFFVLLLGFKHPWSVQVSDGGPRFLVVGSSAAGMLLELVFVVLLLFGMFFPFITADGVARDYQQRAHELLMTTAIPGWAYMGGRYLAGLLVSLLLAIDLLVVTWLLDAGLHLTDAAYPAPDGAALLTVWAITVLPGVVLLGGVSFALGTPWPRRATALKLGVLLLWVALFVVDSSRLPAWFAYWNPTSNSVAAAGESQMIQAFQLHGQTLAAAQAAQGHLPDLQPWLLPHGGLVALGFLLAIGAAIRFRRFRSLM